MGGCPEVETMNAALQIPGEGVARFCQRNHIRRLAVFGSALRHDFGPASDVDVLAEFEPGHVPSLFGLVRLQDELGAVLGGWDVDLLTAEDLSSYFRDEVVREAEVVYVERGSQSPAPHA